LDGHAATYADWLVTVYYYLIIHLVEAFLEVHGDHSRGHDHRESLIEQRLGRVWRGEYRRLRNLTRGFRYECQMPDRRYVETLLSKTVTPFIQHLCGKLSPGDPGRALFRELGPG
jgi:hypothetical protein